MPKETSVPTKTDDGNKTAPKPTIPKNKEYPPFAEYLRYMI